MMKRLLIYVSLAAAAAAQTDYEKLYFSQGYVNCRWYNELKGDGQYGYVAGLWDGVGNSLEVTYGEATKGIASVCSVPENARITVYYAYLIFGLKVIGKDEKAIAELTAEARRFAIYGPEPDVPAPPKPSTKKEKL